MSKTAASPPKHIMKKIVLFSVHCHGDFVTIIVEQLGIFPCALTVFPFDKDDALAILICPIICTLVWPQF